MNWIANKLTVKGTNVDPTAFKEKLIKKIQEESWVGFSSAQKKGGSGSYDKKPEEKKAEKKEEPKKPKEVLKTWHFWIRDWILFSFSLVTSWNIILVLKIHKTETLYV